jgi:transcriptional regulator with XRE-family HTH domain
MAQDKKIVAQRIGQLLASKGMTQTQLAEKSGITQAAISQIVNEERFPTTPVLMKIAKVLTVSIDYLVGQTNTPDVASALGNDETLMKFFRNFQSLDPQMQELLKQQAELMKKQKKNDP